jgi:hypothetical protein
LREVVRSSCSNSIEKNLRVIIGELVEAVTSIIRYGIPSSCVGRNMISDRSLGRGFTVGESESGDTSNQNRIKDWFVGDGIGISIRCLCLGR